MEDKQENKNIKCPTQEEISLKIEELKAAEPMRLLRIERDLKLQESDWRTNNDYPYDNADCLLYTSPSPRDRQKCRMPSSA